MFTKLVDINCCSRAVWAVAANAIHGRCGGGRAGGGGRLRRRRSWLDSLFDWLKAGAQNCPRHGGASAFGLAAGFTEITLIGIVCRQHHRGNRDNRARRRSPTASAFMSKGAIFTRAMFFSSLVEGLNTLARRKPNRTT
jgi:hypothetical protein